MEFQIVLIVIGLNACVLGGVFIAAYLFNKAVRQPRR